MPDELLDPLLPQVHRLENLTEPNRFDPAVSDPEICVEKRRVAVRSAGVLVAFSADADDPAREVRSLVTVLNDPVVKTRTEESRVARGLVFCIRRLPEHFCEGRLVVAGETVLDRLVELRIGGRGPSAQRAVRLHAEFLDLLRLCWCLNRLRCILPVQATGEQ